MYRTSILHRHFGNNSRSRLFWAGLFLGVSVLELSAVAWVSAASVTDTFYGTGAGANTTTGSADSAFGYNALNQNTTGEGNTAVGLIALFANISGIQNTAVGGDALQTCTTDNNTAVGYGALSENATGTNNTAIGLYALGGTAGSSGSNNTASGLEALTANTTGAFNTANGVVALYTNTSGNSNTAVGHAALSSNTTGGSNIALGDSAGSLLSTGSNNIDIGHVGVAGESGNIRIGTSGTQTATFIAGIRGVPVAGGQPVGVSASGQLGVRASSARFKEAIKPMGHASEAIVDLKPVTFRYKKELDPKGTPEFGLIAEQVAKVAPELVTLDDQGKPFTVRYEAVNAMLLNEFLNARRRAAAEAIKVEGLEKKLTEQQKQIEALTDTLQKVSNELNLMKAMPRVVANTL
jgi:Chaperone of endosialidase